MSEMQTKEQVKKNNKTKLLKCLKESKRTEAFWNLITVSKYLTQ